MDFFSSEHSNPIVNLLTRILSETWEEFEDLSIELKDLKVTQKENDNLRMYVKSLKKLAKKSINKKDLCSICLEKLDNSVEITVCGHIFHTDCIYDYRITKCPVCRFHFVGEPEQE